MVWADRTGNIGWQAVGITPLRPQLERAAAGARRRPLRVGRLPADQRAAARGEPGDAASSPRPTTISSRRTSRTPRRCTTPGPIRTAPRASAEMLGSGRLLQRRRDGAAAERRPVDAGAQPGAAAAATSPLAEAARRPRRATCCSAWDFVLDKDSVPPASTRCGSGACWPTCASRWCRRRRAGLRRPSALSMKRVIDWLYAPDGRFGADPVKGRDALLVAQPGRGGGRADASASGRTSASWQWGQDDVSPRADPPSAVSAAVNDATRAKLNVGPLPRGGDGYTVSATGGADNQTSGGSFKIIADAENWDNSVGLNNPGQSGNPDEPALPRPVRHVVEGPLLPRRLLTRRRWSRSRRASHSSRPPVTAQGARRLAASRQPLDLGARSARAGSPRDAPRAPR